MTYKKEKWYSLEEAKSRLQQYCSYQDRCHKEVRYKLIELKIYGDDLENIMAELIEEKYLDEERFARSYARGKFRMKKWGRNKITRELKFRQVSAYCIKKGLSEIDEEDYRKVVQSELEKYYTKLSGKKPIKKNKTYDHGARRGYESHIMVPMLGYLVEDDLSED